MQPQSIMDQIALSGAERDPYAIGLHYSSDCTSPRVSTMQNVVEFCVTIFVGRLGQQPLKSPRNAGWNESRGGESMQYHIRRYKQRRAAAVLRNLIEDV